MSIANEDGDFGKPMTDLQILKAARRTTPWYGMNVADEFVRRNGSIPRLPELERVEYCEFGFVEYREVKS